MQLKLTILTLFVALLSFGQTKVHVDKNSRSYEWQCVAKGQWGSYWWQVERELNRRDDGYYYYKAYFYSNSYMQHEGQAVKAISYIKDVKISMYSPEHNPIHVNLDYVVADWEKKYVAYFYSTDPRCVFSISNGMITPYNYSGK